MRFLEARMVIPFTSKKIEPTLNKRNKRSLSLRTQVCRASISLFLCMVIGLVGTLGAYLEVQYQKDTDDTMLSTMDQAKRAITDLNEDDIAHFIRNYEGFIRGCPRDPLIELQKCWINAQAFLGYNENEHVDICIDRKEESEAYAEYLYVSYHESSNLCDARAQDTGIWGKLWEEVKGASGEIRDVVWGGTQATGAVFNVYEDCIDGSSEDCKDVYELIGEPVIKDRQWRIRVLKVGSSGWFQDRWSWFKTSDSDDRRKFLAMVLVAMCTATATIVAMSWWNGRRARDLEKQADRLRDQLEDQGATAIDNRGYCRELTGIAVAADARVAAAKMLRERLMMCARRLGRAIDHNENALLSELHLSQPEEGKNLSWEQLRTVTKAVSGIRKNLEGISKQLIWWSIGEFSGASDFVHVGETLSEGIAAVQVCSKRNLKWDDRIPELSLRTGQFGFFAIAYNLAMNAEQSASTQVRVTARKRGEEVEIVVENDGDGFPDSIVARKMLLNWEHRARLHNASVSRSGIGLAMVAEWLRGGNGSIELSSSSELGGGCVTIRVRCVEVGS